MALPTILILGLLVAGIPAITCRFASYASEVSDNTEMSNRKVIEKKFTCPAIYGRYPHPESCEYYFECRFGWPTLWHCNRGYLYDREKEQCIDKRKVKCRIGHERDHDHHRDNKDKDKEIDVKEDVGHFQCPYIWGTFAHPYDCSKYYVCVYNYPKLFQCYRNFLYDTHYRKCLPSNKVKCGNRRDRDQIRTSRRPVVGTTTVKPVEITTVIPKNKFYCPFPYGRYPDPEDCSRFYECRFSIPHLHTCPESTLYHERKEQCLDKTRVKCGNRPGGNDEDVITEDDKNLNFRCPYIWGTFAHPVDCSKYIICIYNVPSVFTCRKNELFDAYHRRCLPQDKVTCDDRINPDDPYPYGKTTVSPNFSTLTPSTVKELPESTTMVITTTISTTTTRVPTTTTTTDVPTTTTTPIPTTTTTTTPMPTTTTTTTPMPTTTTTTTPIPTTTTTTTPVPTTTTTTTTTPAPTTTTTTTTPVPTTVPTTTTSTPIPTTAPTSTVSSEATTIPEFSTILPVTKPNTPPSTDCADDDLDCIIDETGDISGWFDCPKRFGHFPHGSSKQLFIHCDNWRPFVKRCAEHTNFSPVYLVCVWENRKQVM